MACRKSASEARKPRSPAAVLMNEALNSMIERVFALSFTLALTFLVFVECDYVSYQYYGNLIT